MSSNSAKKFPYPSADSLAKKKKRKLTQRNWGGYRVKKENWRLKTPQGVDSVLKRLFSKPSMQAKFSKYAFVSHWYEIVGKDIAEHAKPLKLANKILYIQVDSPLWAQELGFLKDEILDRLKSYATDDQALNDVRFIVC